MAWTPARAGRPNRRSLEYRLLSPKRSGTLSIPPDTEVTIGKDGTVSTVPGTNQKNQVSEVGRLKLVNPPEGNLVRGDDGFFRLADGGTAQANPNVFLHPGALESSNINPAEALVSIINLQRQFDMHIKLLQNAEQNATKASTILNFNG